MDQPKGFTLIELLVVIGIIATLATIGAVSFSTARGKSRDAKRIGDIDQVVDVMETEAAYKVDETYPVTLPANLNVIFPPNGNTDSYCYYRRGDGLGYYITSTVMETEFADDGDETNGIAIELGAVGVNEYEEGLDIGGGSGCLTDGQVLDCDPNPDTVHCRSGQKSG